MDAQAGLRNKTMEGIKTYFVIGTKDDAPNNENGVCVLAPLIKYNKVLVSNLYLNFRKNT